MRLADQLVAAVVAFALALAAAGIHQVPQGHVGVYYRAGALLNVTETPGLHWMTPVMERMYPVQVTLQTDEVRDIPCGTSGGVMIHFDKVEVVNALRQDAVLDTVRLYGVNYDDTWIFKKIHHELNQFCSSHSLQEIYIEKFDTVDDLLKRALMQDIQQYCPGLDIIAVRITKPRVPKTIDDNYRRMEEQKTMLRIAKEHERVVMQEANTERQRLVMEAQREAEVAEIQMKKQVMEKEGKKRMQEIEDEASAHRQRMQADASLYAAKQAAEGNRLKLSREYLELERIRSTSANSKIFFGPDVPSLFFTPSMGGGDAGARAATGSGSDPVAGSEYVQHVDIPEMGFPFDTTHRDVV